MRTHFACGSFFIDGYSWVLYDRKKRKEGAMYGQHNLGDF